MTTALPATPSATSENARWRPRPWILPELIDVKREVNVAVVCCCCCWNVVVVVVVSNPGVGTIGISNNDWDGFNVFMRSNGTWTPVAGVVVGAVVGVVVAVPGLIIVCR